MLFEAKMIDGSEPVASEFAALWPIQRFPVIVDDGQFVFEATGIIEYLEARFPETARLIPSDLPLAAEVRMWDRFFDNYVSYPQGRLVVSGSSQGTVGPPAPDLPVWGIAGASHVAGHGNLHL